MIGLLSLRNCLIGGKGIFENFDHLSTQPIRFQYRSSLQQPIPRSAGMPPLHPKSPITFKKLTTEIEKQTKQPKMISGKFAIPVNLLNPPLFPV